MRKRITIVILFIAVLSVILIPYSPCVVFYKGKSEEVLGYAPSGKDGIFSVIYTHSIHLSPVEEVYEAGPGGTIRQTELIYEDFGIGMPSGSDGQGVFVEAGGKYHLKEMDLTFPSIYLRTGKVRANHVFKADSREVPFSSFAEPGSLVNIQIVKLSLWEKWKEVNIFG